ncbi:MAG: glycosyltransferase [Desulfamplus sp.]|nr:glycosyltransferase [Desulfamplus sp.]
MKILYVNWAPLWRGAEVGGGVNIYSQSMAVKLSESGHRLFSISAGFAYDFKNRAYIKRGPDFMGVKNYEIFNAPNIAPGFFNYENPMQDVSEPVVEKLFDEFIKHIKPDIVHFHNIEGFSCHCIEISVRRGCKTLFSLHNYHPVCNQIYLLYKDRDICNDFNNGYKCLDCIKPPSYSKEIMKRRIAFHVNRLPFGDRIWRKLQRIAGLAAGFSATQNVNRLLKKLSSDKPSGLPLFYQAINQNKRDISDNRHILYGKRRKLIIESLNQAHMVHAVSDFVRDFYISQGVKSHLVTTCHIGNKMAEVSIGSVDSLLQDKGKRDCQNTGDLSENKKKMAISYSEAINNGATRKPLKIIFLGISSQPKGLPFLLETLLSMDKHNSEMAGKGQQNIAEIKYNKILKQISLHIHARGVWELYHLIEPLSKKLSSIEVHDGYDFNNLPNILCGMNYGVVPPLWYDNAPQVVFEMMAMKVPVIGANIGGIPDFVKDMSNGILFNPGDRSDLASKISMVVNERALECQLRDNIKPMKTPAQHACELQRFYKEI